MAKIMRIIKNNRGQAFCSKCKKEIEPGDEYLKATPYRKKPIIRCIDCGIKTYELSSSPYVRQVYSLINWWKSKKWADADDVEHVIKDVEDMKYDVEYSLFNMPSNTLLQDRLQSLENCLNELETIDIDDDCDIEEDEDCSINYRDDIFNALQLLT